MNQTSINKIRRSKNTRIKEKDRRREKLSIRGFHRSRIGPDQPGPKTDFKERGDRRSNQIDLNTHIFSLLEPSPWFLSHQGCRDESQDVATLHRGCRRKGVQKLLLRRPLDTSQRQFVEHRGVFKEICTSCILRLHQASFWPTCFSLYDPNSINPIPSSISGASSAPLSRTPLTYHPTCRNREISTLHAQTLRSNSSTFENLLQKATRMNRTVEMDRNRRLGGTQVGHKLGRINRTVESGEWRLEMARNRRWRF